jgi:hypothetical protein
MVRCANSPCNHLKYHNHTWPHPAAIYPAIRFSCCQPSSLLHATLRWRVWNYEVRVRASWRFLIAQSGGEHAVCRGELRITILWLRRQRISGRIALCLRQACS